MIITARQKSAYLLNHENELSITSKSKKRVTVRHLCNVRVLSQDFRVRFVRLYVCFACTRAPKSKRKVPEKIPVWTFFTASIPSA